MIEKLPLCYFKPTVCWVDDDEIFLEAVTASFKGEYNCLRFTKSEKALNFLASYTPPTSQVNFKRDFKESDVFDTKNHYPIDINIHAIAEILNITEKINEISVLVIDYNMPEINGIEVCNRLKSFPFKKILLTGEATYEKAIEGFNNGVIDKFLQKDINVAEKLHLYIEELCKQYFYEKTKDLVTHFKNSNAKQLFDPVFYNVFNNWCKENNITEYYLISRQGCFLAKDNQEKIHYFISMSETDKNEFISINEDATDIVGPLLNKMNEGKLLPFFGMGKESWEFNQSEWKHHFYPAKVIESREKYYWTIVSDE